MAADENPPKKSKGCLKYGLIGLGTVIAVVAGMAVLGICPPPGPWPAPPWCGSETKQPAANTESKTDQEATSQASAEPTPVPVWTPPQTEVDIYNKHCRYPFEDPQDEVMIPSVIGFGWNLNQEQWEIDHAHSCGALFISEVSMMNHDAWREISDLPSELKDAYVSDNDGNLVYSQDLVFLNGMHPAFRQWLGDFIKNQIDMGADGFVFDEYHGGASAVEMGAGLDDFSQAGFYDYLIAEHGLEYLEGEGISADETFNYAVYLKENNALGTYEKDYRKAPFGLDFYQYMKNESNRLVGELIQLARSYAAEKGKSIRVTANYNSLYHTDEDTFAEKLDYYTFEHTYLVNPRLDRNGNKFFPAGVPAAPSLRFPRSQDKYGVILMNIFDYGELAKLDKTVATTLTQHFFAEAYANRGFLLYFDLEMEFIGNQFVADHAMLRPYYAFLRQNPKLFNNLLPLADAAVVMPPHNSSTDYGPIDASQGAAWLLAGENIPYDVIGIDDLNSNYRLALVNGYAWSDSELAKLILFAESGGTVIAFDNRFASMDQSSNPVDRPELNGLLANGVHETGKGKFIFFSDNLAWRYYAQLDQNAREQLRKTIHQFVASNSAPQNVQLIPYNGNERFVVHLLNYGYDQDGFVNLENFEISIDLPPQFNEEGRTLTLLSPDREETVQLEFTIQDGTLKTTIPELIIWNVLMLE